MLTIRIFLKFLSLACFLYQNSVSAYKFKSIEFLLPSYGSSITHILFSPDSKKLVTASEDKKVRVFDAQRGSLLFSIESSTLAYTNICFDEMGHLITILNKKIELWNLEKGIKLKNHHHDRKCPHELLSPDGSKKLQIFNRNKVLIYSADTGEMESKIKSLSAITHAYFEPDNKVITFSPEGVVRLFDSQGQLERLLTKKELRHHMAMSQNQQQLAVVLSDWSVRLRHVLPFELRTPESMKTLREAGLTYIHWLGQFLDQAQEGSTINSDNLAAYIAQTVTVEEAQKISALGFKALPQSCQSYVQLLFSLHDRPRRGMTSETPIF